MQLAVNLLLPLRIVVYHSSSMEDKFAAGVCTGRPFGGTAILVHKKLSRLIELLA